MIEIITHYTIPAALSILIPSMNTPAARAMLLAIGLQESRFLHRRQVGPGPARGFWQFEKNGVRGVMEHPASREHLEGALRVLRYEGLIDQPANVQYASEDNDVLACVLARLLLWTVPAALPDRDDDAAGWAQYLEGWRPGKPHPATWKALYREAWDRVEQEQRP